jgi:hypothetical protein
MTASGFGRSHFARFSLDPKALDCACSPAESRQNVKDSMALAMAGDMGAKELQQKLFSCDNFDTRIATYTCEILISV